MTEMNQEHNPEHSATPAHLPLADGTMYSQRKGFCPLRPPFVTVPLDSYIPIVGELKIERLRNSAEKLKGVKILELNSTAQGGGVAEMLLSSVPLLNQIGVDDEWKVISGNKPFYQVTKSIHNILQGQGNQFTAEMESMYLESFKSNGNGHIVDYEPDVVIIHDPQPLGASPYLNEPETKRGKWLWRCHIEMHEETLMRDQALERFINRWIRHYDGVIFSAAHYIISHWPFPKFVISPFIDPLSEKNRELSQPEIESVLTQHGIEPKIPIISQIGRFDPWKGITRTIETYRLARKSVKCQLVLAGGLASDDPEGEEILAEIHQKVKDDPDVHILNLPPTSPLEINAIQRASQVILQPSIREGFGLTVTEALWKGKPVIASPVGGILLQLRDGEHGYFYHNPKDSAERVIYLLTHPRVAKAMGKRGTDYVRQHFLLPDRLADYLKAISMVTQMNPDPESIISFHARHNPNQCTS